MDLTEIKTAAEGAVAKIEQAQSVNHEFVEEAMRAAFEAMQVVEGVGPIAHQGEGQPYDYTEARNRMQLVADHLFVCQAALQTASEYSKQAAELATEAQGLIGPVLPEGFKLVTSANTHLEEAKELLSGMFEIEGPILPIQSTTAGYRLSQAKQDLLALIGMLS